MKTATQFEDQAQFKQVACIVITHPKRKGHAVINVAYPKDGAGRLTVYVLDSFGEGGRTCTRHPVHRRAGCGNHPQ